MYLKMYSNLMAVPYQNSFWSKAFPKLVNILDDDPTYPKRNLIHDNLIAKGTPECFVDSRARPYNNTVVNNTLNVDMSWFENPFEMNFKLRDGNPYENTGRFPRIPFEEIGLIKVTTPQPEKPLPSKSTVLEKSTNRAVSFATNTRTFAWHDWMILLVLLQVIMIMSAWFQ